MQTAYTFPLDNRQITIGRDPSCDIPISGIGISRVHARIFAEQPARIADAGSSFGIRLNRRQVEKEALLADGNCITIGVTDWQVAVHDNLLTLVRMKSASEFKEKAPRIFGDMPLRIGRDDANEIQLTHPLVSRFHCCAQRTIDGAYEVSDLGSTNGTFVNGRAVTKAAIVDGDVVQVGPYRFILEEGTFIQADDYSRVRLEAFDVSVRRGGVSILDKVSLCIPSGEFVAILGPSGAGKTTLAQALTGQIGADEGEIYYNGLSLRKFVAAFNASIGFVSQHNLLRPELTVWETFWEQSILRLPGDSLNAERVERIGEVLKILEITRLSKRRIARLSGGEAKRVHVGIELLSSPTILFLDEPLAGLDPGLIHKFMQLFRGLCDRGHTLLLTTHTLEQIELCGKMLFVSRGKVVFDGTPAQARERLDVQSLADMYETVRTQQMPQRAQDGDKRGDDDTPYNPSARGMLSEHAPAYHPRTSSPIRQFLILARRYAKVFVRDTKNMALVLLQAPLIALLLGLVFQADADFLPISFYFCVTISAIWIGGVNSIREIAREWQLFEREYRVGLRAGAFLAAKLSVFALLSIVQALLFCASLHLVFTAFTFNSTLLALVASGCICGSFLGLCVSAFSGSVTRAISWLPIVFIPQIFLSGILIPFDRMPVAGKLLSHLTFSRPVFSMFKKVCLLDQIAWELEEWRALLLLASGLIILMFCRIRWYYIFSRARNA